MNDFQRFDDDFKAFHKTMRWALAGGFVIAVAIVVIIAVAVLR